MYGKDGALLIPSPNTKKAAPELLLLLQGNSWFLCDSNKHWAQALQRQAMARSASGPKGSLLGGALLWQPVGCTAQQRPQRGRLRRKLHKGEWSGEGRWCLIHSPFLSHVLFLQMTPDEVSIFQEASRVPKQSPQEDSKGKWQQKQTWYGAFVSNVLKYEARALKTTWSPELLSHHNSSARTRDIIGGLRCSEKLQMDLRPWPFWRKSYCKHPAPGVVRLLRVS